MHYVSAENLSKSYGINPLFSNISFHIEEGDKIALVARNGAGKSTLLKILAGRETADEGKLWIHKDVTAVLLDQDPEFHEELSILENIFYHDHPVIRAIRNYESVVDAGDSKGMEQAVISMDELGAWDFEARVKQILGKLKIDHLNQPVSALSGGQRKRVALAKTLIDTGFEHRHVLLIMDEPTNHLDVEMVEWLESFLNKEKITLFLVTHDRYFLDNVCNEIWELDENRLYPYTEGYADFLIKKAARAEADASSIEKAKNTYRKELDWMRRQPQARTTKSKSRIDAFYEVEERASRKTDNPEMQLQVKMTRLGGKIVELKKVYKSFSDLIILKGFDYTFRKGERVGIVGPNGVGKSTFIRLVQGLEKADSGKVNIGETVVFGNYSQQGLDIKDDMRVIEYVKSFAEQFPLADGGSLSASEFLNLFLFPPSKQHSFISKLSGGEKRRLHLLTILFRNPNFLVLDEPTNDLDLPTLAVLENFLDDFAGCVMIVSHDRYFMDRLVDHLFVFEGKGVIRDFPGNYSRYREWKDAQFQERKSTADLPVAKEKSSKEKKKAGFREKREFETLEKEMEALTREKDELTVRLNSNSASYEQLNADASRIAEINHLLDEKEMRWLELSEII